MHEDHRCGRGCRTKNDDLEHDVLAMVTESNEMKNAMTLCCVLTFQVGSSS